MQLSCTDTFALRILKGWSHDLACSHNHPTGHKGTAIRYVKDIEQHLYVQMQSCLYLRAIPLSKSTTENLAWNLGYKYSQSHGRHSFSATLSSKCCLKMFYDSEILNKHNGPHPVPTLTTHYQQHILQSHRYSPHDSLHYILNEFPNSIGRHHQRLSSGLRVNQHHQMWQQSDPVRFDSLRRVDQLDTPTVYVML